jgi:hypothetical protein
MARITKQGKVRAKSLRSNSDHVVGIRTVTNIGDQIIPSKGKTREQAHWKARRNHQKTETSNKLWEVVHSDYRNRERRQNCVFPSHSLLIPNRRTPKTGALRWG